MSAIAVFAGPTIGRAEVAARMPDARIEPPAARGNLDRLRAEGVSTFLIIDGVFAHALAVSPGEVVRTCRAGARVIGAASLGAIRAAECAPAGVEGVGAVQQLYRWRVIRDDDEVAVAVDPSRDHRAVSDALIAIRFAVLAGLRRGLLDRRQASAVLASAKATHFSRRRWFSALADAGVEDSDELRAVWRAGDVKRRDAELALERLSAGPGGDAVPRGRGPASAAATGLGAWVGRRYHGHDPLLGLGEAGARDVLTTWLRESGRWPRYLGAEPGPADEDLVWDRLVRARELESELLRWYAVARSADQVPSPR